MSTFIGDYLGFSLGQYHSHQLNIVRTSTNDRYIENMLPAFTDSTAVAVGGNGTYYWNTSYTQKVFTIDFAFDDLHEVDVQRLKRAFGFKGVQPLIFDELPYKKYMVKCLTPPTLKYICFEEGGVKIYKGEGSVQLVSFYPFGISTTEKPIVYNPKMQSSFVYNDGEVEGEFKLIYKIYAEQDGSQEPGTVGTITLRLRKERNGSDIGLLQLQKIRKIDENDIYFQIDSYTNLIEGLDANFNKTGTLYNKFITGGDFFKLPVGDGYLITKYQHVSGSYTPLYY